MPSFEAEARYLTIEQERMGARFAQAVCDLQKSFSWDEMPKAFYIVLRDEVTGRRFADCYSRMKSQNGEVRLRSQSVPYVINDDNNMLDILDKVEDSLVEKLLVCDKSSVYPLQEWIERNRGGGLYYVWRRNGRLANLYLLNTDSDLQNKASLPEPISPQPSFVLR